MDTVVSTSGIRRFEQLATAELPLVSTGEVGAKNDGHDAFGLGLGDSGYCWLAAKSLSFEAFYCDGALKGVY